MRFLGFGFGGWGSEIRYLRFEIWVRSSGVGDLEIEDWSLAIGYRRYELYGLRFGDLGFEI